MKCRNPGTPAQGSAVNPKIELMVVLHGMTKKGLLCSKEKPSIPQHVFRDLFHGNGNHKCGNGHRFQPETPSLTTPVSCAARKSIIVRNLCHGLPPDAVCQAVRHIVDRSPGKEPTLSRWVPSGVMAPIPGSLSFRTRSRVPSASPIRLSMNREGGDFILPLTISARKNGVFTKKSKKLF